MNSRSWSNGQTGPHLNPLPGGEEDAQRLVRIEYLSKENFQGLDGRYQATVGMLSRMIDRADDFCKNAPATDYRTIVREEKECLFTGHDLHFPTSPIREIG